MPDIEQPQHSTPEDRIGAGSVIATFEDLEGLTQDQLYEVANECLVEILDSTICVPCRATEILMEGDEETRAMALAILENPLGTDQSMGETVMPEPRVQGVNDLLPPEPTTEESTAFESELPQEEDVRILFARQVHALNLTVKQMLEGAPIPPPNVSVEELAALVVGADLWLKDMDARIAEGFALTDPYEERRQHIALIVGRLKA